VSRQQRLAFAGIAVLIALVAVLVLASGGDDDEQADRPPTVTTQAEDTPTPGATESPEATETETPTPEPTPEVETIEYRDGEVVGGEAELEFDKGETVRFAVKSDTADEVHVHGYDLKKDVKAGGTVRFSFEADLDGIFEVELEALGKHIARLRVNP